MLVSPLPEGNLIQLPWFHTPEQPLVATFGDVWVPDIYWNLAVAGNKNPSPDHVKGTAAKHGPVQLVGQGLPYIDAFLHQIVDADPLLTTLEFSTWWEGVKQEYLEINIFGIENGNSSVLLWTPFRLEENSGGWVQVSASTLIEAGYTQYQIQIRSNFPEASLGTKVTGLYFRVI